LGSTLSIPPTLIRLFNDSLIGSDPKPAAKKFLMLSNIYSSFAPLISGYLPINRRQNVNY